MVPVCLWAYFQFLLRLTRHPSLHLTTKKKSIHQKLYYWFSTLNYWYLYKITCHIGKINIWNNSAIMFKMWQEIHWIHKRILFTFLELSTRQPWDYQILQWERKNEEKKGERVSQLCCSSSLERQINFTLEKQRKLGVEWQTAFAHLSIG